MADPQTRCLPEMTNKGMRGNFYYLDQQSVPFDLIHTIPDHCCGMFSFK